MNGKKCKILRGQCANRQSYLHLKKACNAQTRTDRAQRPAVVKLRAHKPKKAIKPTWPHSDDQKTQARAIIVARPMRALILAMLNSNPAHPKTGKRRLSADQLARVVRVLTAPKHYLDSLALSY